MPPAPPSTALACLRCRAVYDGMLGRRSGWSTELPGNENHAVLQAERARLCFRRGEYVTAAALLKNALLLEGDDVDILAMLGRTRRLACPADPKAGEAELRKALSLDPTAEFAWLWLAEQHRDRGEVEVARSILRSLLSRDPEFEPARQALRTL